MQLLCRLDRADLMRLIRGQAYSSVQWDATAKSFRFDEGGVSRALARAGEFS